MNVQPALLLENSFVATRLSLCAAALAGAAGTITTAQAALVSFSTAIPVPASLAGVYINLLTGATGTSGAGVVGWDFNPYLASGGTQLGFYWAPVPAGGVAGSPTGPYLDLPVGTVISGASTFTRSITGTTGSPYLTTGTRTLGFAFLNEGTAATNFGYLTMTTSATNGFPATITGWTFENSGAAITVVPEASTGILAVLAMGAVQLRRRRRKN